MAFTDTVLESARKIALDVVRKYSPTFQWAAVTSTDPLHVTYDGRADPLAVSPSTLVGGLMVGDRVYVVTYMRRAVIVGKAGGQYVTQHIATATDGLSVTTTAADVPGCSITLMLQAGDVVQAVGIFDVQAKGTIFLGLFYADGVAVPGEAHSQASGRATISQVWQWTCETSGSHTLKLVAKTDSGTATLFKDHQRLALTVIHR
jgi:hypothetical protein